MNIKDLINLAGEEGKVVVLGEDGEVRGVFLVYNEYQKLAAIKPIRKPKQEQVIEEVNRAIMQAQLSEGIDTENKNLEIVTKDPNPPQPLNQLLSKRAQEIFGDKPFGRGEEPLYDMRAEVIDPHYGAPQPVVESDNDEEIKPEFDDI